MAIRRIATGSSGSSGGPTDPEIVRDTVAAALVAGPGVTITVDDTSNTITITATGTSGGGGTGGTGQAAVSLVAIDGEYISGSTQSNFIGAGYYTRNNLTKATSWTGPNPLGGTFNGWDDVNFFPIQSWLADDQGPGDAIFTRYLDLGINVMLPANNNVDLAKCASYGIGAFVYSGHYATPSAVPVAGRPAVLGVNSGEEPLDATQFATIRDANNLWVAASGGAGHMTHINYTDLVLAYDVTEQSAVWMVGSHIVTEDQYTFADAYDTGNPAEIPYGRWEIYTRLYDFDFGVAGNPATVAQTARGSHYGSQASAMRGNFNRPGGGPSRPVGVFVEVAAPYDNTASLHITPPQLKWAVFASLVHGGRMVPYFQHSFKPSPGFSYNAFLDDYYGGPGVAGTGIYAAVKQLNYQILSVASVINSPKDGYFVYGAANTNGAVSQPGFLTAVTSTNPRDMFSGVDAVCKWQPVEQRHYILSTTREQDGATNIPATYRMVDQGQTTAVEVFESRNITINRGGSIPTGFCEFSDPFVTAASYHCYRIQGGTETPSVGPTPTWQAAGTYIAREAVSPASVPAPAGVVANSVVVIVAIVNISEDPVVTPPSGFQVAAEIPVFDGSGGLRLYVMWHRAVGPESGPYEITYTGGVGQPNRYVEAQAHRYEGCVVTGTPIEAVDSAFRTTAGTTSAGVSTTTTDANRRVLVTTATSVINTWTQPAGYTHRGGGGFSLVGLFDREQAAAGSTGTVQAGQASGTSLSWIGALIPAVV